MSKYQWQAAKQIDPLKAPGPDDIECYHIIHSFSFSQGGGQNSINQVSKVLGENPHNIAALKNLYQRS